MESRIIANWVAQQESSADNGQVNISSGEIESNTSANRVAKCRTRATEDKSRATGGAGANAIAVGEDTISEADASLGGGAYGGP